MLDERKIKAIELSMQGIQNPDIAKAIGVSRQTVWNWLNNDEEVKNEVDRLGREISKTGERYTANKLIHNLNSLQEQADAPDTPQGIKANIRMYLIDRTLGKPTSKVEQSIDQDKEHVSKDILENEFDEVDKPGNN